MRAIYEMCYLTGQRIGDVLSIRLADISADGIAFKQEKTNARLLVQMTPDLEELIARIKALPEEDPWPHPILFPARREAGALQLGEGRLCHQLQEGWRRRREPPRPACQVAFRY